MGTGLTVWGKMNKKILSVEKKKDFPTVVGENPKFK